MVRLLNPSQQRLLCATTVACLVAAPGLSAGVVRTVDGQLIEGDVTFDPRGALTVKRDGHNPVTVPFVKLARATLAGTEESPAASGFHAADWTAEDIGEVGLAGGAGLTGDKWWLRSGGGYIGEKEDGFHFANTKVTGDCEIAARVIKVACNDQQGRAGVMLREVLQGRSRFVALLVKADGTMSLRGRTEWGAQADVRFTQPAATPIWIKLKKDKDQFTAFKSNDGRRWDSLGQITVSLGREFHAGLAIANRNASAPCTAVIEPLELTVSGLWGEYFADPNFGTVQLTRLDPQIEFHWGQEAPDARLPKDQFSVRWTGQIEPKHSEGYSFYYDADDTARLWINGQEIPHRPIQREAVKPEPHLSLHAGQRYDVKLEFQEIGGPAFVRLGWSSRSQALELVPADRLFCARRPTPERSAPPVVAPSSDFPLTKGVLLRSGTFLTGSISTLDDDAVKLRRPDGQDWSGWWHQIALIVFRPPQRAFSINDLGDRTGVLMQNGDWFEGEVRRIKHRKLQVSSVLYGMKDFAAHQGEVAAWLLQPFQRTPAPFEIRTTDGSVLLAQNLTCEPEALRLDEPALGNVRVPHVLVREISCFRNP